MKTSLPVFLLLIILLSCKDKTPASATEICGVKDPIRNLRWLRELVDEAKRKKEDGFMTIVAVEVGGETVINYYLSYMSCIGCVSYHCDGSRFDMSNYTQSEIQEYQKNIWGTSGNRVVLWPAK
jgi:hypothetical protein